MADGFDSQFLREPVPKRRSAALAVFGKHPAWTDHMDDLGVTTKSLAVLKQWLYVEGVGGAIAAGQWEKLARQGQVIPFGHDFLWRRGPRWIVGRLLASQDGKGRDQYPLVIAAHVQGMPHLPAPPMDSLATRIAEAQDMDAARQAWQQGARELERFVEAAPISPKTSVDERRRFVESAALGPERVGLLRVMHVLATRWTGRARQAVVLRLPGSGQESLAAWAGFFAELLPPEELTFLAFHREALHLDALIGVPTRADFACLRASTQALALTTSTPYTLALEFQTKAASFLDAFVRGNVKTAFLAESKPARWYDPRTW